MGNILFRLPDSERSSCESVLQRFGIPEIGKVARKDGAPLERGLPEYLVAPVEFDRKDYEQLNEIQLIDFGEGIYSPMLALIGQPL